MKSIQQNGRKEMLTDEQASSWKKAKNSIQQNRRKEMLTNDQASSWKNNELNSTQWKQGNAQVSSWKKQWSQFNRMQEKNLKGE